MEHIVIEETTKNKKYEGLDSKGSTTAESACTKNAEEGKKIQKVQSMEAEKVLKIKSSGAKRLTSTPIAPSKPTSVVKCSDASRDKIWELLSEAWGRVSSEAGEDLRDEVNACDPSRVAVTMETLMFKKRGHFNGLKKSKYRSISFNIKDPKKSLF